MQYYNDLLCHCGKSVKRLNTPVGGRMLDTKPVVAISTIGYVTDSRFTDQTCTVQLRNNGLLGDNRLLGQSEVT